MKLAIIRTNKHFNNYKEIEYELNFFNHITDIYVDEDLIDFFKKDFDNVHLFDDQEEYDSYLIFMKYGEKYDSIKKKLQKIPNERFILVKYVD